MKVVRGARIQQSIDEEATFTQLRQNIEKGFPETKKRQHAIGEVNIVRMQFVPYAGALEVHAVSRSNGHDYAQKIIFSDVVNANAGEGASFTGNDNKLHQIQPIDLQGARVKVNCTCLDFHHRFASWNFSADALSGAKPPLYQRKTTDHPPVNPLRVPGICKHLIKLVDTLRQQQLVR